MNGVETGKQISARVSENVWSDKHAKLSVGKRADNDMNKGVEDDNGYFEVDALQQV